MPMWITAVRNTYSLDCCMLHHGLRWNWGGGAFLLYWTLKLASRLILSRTYFILKFLAGAGGEGVHICEEFWHGFLKYHFKCSLTRWHAFLKKMFGNTNVRRMPATFVHQFESCLSAKLLTLGDDFYMLFLFLCCEYFINMEHVYTNLL